MKLLMAAMLANPFCILTNTTQKADPVSDVARSDEKEWRYETRADGHRYKRLYNYTTGKWETDWILVW